MLDIDFGTFPFVTSSNTTSAGVCSGLGIAPQQIKDVMGITKAYCTRVGGGPFPTELEDATGEELRRLGSEFGATTGRPRRCGWIDLVALKYACMINGVTKLIMTKADVLDSFQQLQLCTAYDINGEIGETVPFQMTRYRIKPILKNLEGWNSVTASIDCYKDLPEIMKNYVSYINNYTGINISHISNGPGREQIISVPA
jgi:adenylosuccinate synthase